MSYDLGPSSLCAFRYPDEGLLMSKQLNFPKLNFLVSESPTNSLAILTMSSSSTLSLCTCNTIRWWLREDLFGTVTEVSGTDIANLDSETLCNLLLYGSSNMNMIDNRTIIEATIEYIEKTNRLN